MYNEANCCHKGNIKVEGEDAKESEDTCCGSFAERGDRCAKNVTGDAPKNIEVACCAANCVFNKEEKCSRCQLGFPGGNGLNWLLTECPIFCCGEEVFEPAVTGILKPEILLESLRFSL